jgi:glyoxylase-like metal-dependent hydrolase (beta-lactamase superfamily II)
VRRVTPTLDLGNQVHEIDTLMSGHTGITAGYAILGDHPCLIETGTAKSAPVVRDALAALGVGPRDLKTIVVTHIHLDHAGGVGDLAAMFPEAEVVVHASGARHLVDPERLMRSARRVFGSLMDDVFGPLLPTEAARVRAVEDIGAIDLGGGRRLELHHTPGHARHHVGLIDSLTGDLYVGDAAGIYIPSDDPDQPGDVRPGTPPPDFDLDLAVNSLATFGTLRPTRLLFSHYGPVRDVEDTLARAEEEVRLWVELVRDARQDRLDLDHAIQMVREKTAARYPVSNADDETATKFEELSSYASNIVGINMWLNQNDGWEHPMADAASAG